MESPRSPLERLVRVRRMNAVKKVDKRTLESELVEHFPIAALLKPSERSVLMAKRLNIQLRFDLSKNVYRSSPLGLRLFSQKQPCEARTKCGEGVLPTVMAYRANDTDAVVCVLGDK